jgi:TPR repeat protein
MTEQNTFSISELQQQANSGEAQAQFELALCYAKGTDIEKNLELAFDWHKKAVEQGHVNAQFTLGLYYFLNTGRKYFDMLLCKGINNPNIEHTHYLAVMLALSVNMKDADDNLAFSWFKKASENDSAEALYWLAQCYLDGIGTQKNDELAFDSFKKAAEHSYPNAYYPLALCYCEGKGCQQNYELALAWITKAVEYADAYFLRIKNYGTDFEKNIAETYLFLGKLYVDGKGAAQNDELAFKLFTKAAEKEVAEAQYLLGRCYEHGIGVERNMNLADKWYEGAKLQNYFEPGDQFRLAERYLYRKGVEKNYELGMKWMIRAAHAGHADACKWLTNAYLSLAIPSRLSDKEDAEQYYKFAADWCLKNMDGHNAAEANLLLGVLYCSGKGIAQNDALALDCFKKADEAIMRVANGDDYESIQSFIDCYLLCKGESRYEYLSHSFYDIVGDAFVEGILKIRYRENPNHKTFLTLLRATIYKKAGEYGLAKDYIKEAFDKDEYMDNNLRDIYLTGIEQEQEIAEKNKRLELEVKEKENANHRMQKLVEQFTHSLGNVIFPDTIYQVVERLKTNPECRKDVLLLNEAYHSEIIIKLQGELLRQRYANINPEKFRQFIRSCRRTQNHADKTKSIEDILDYAASRVTARFLNQHYAGLNSIRDNILSKKNVSLDALKQKFEDDILLNKSLRPIAWINQNLRPIQITEISPLWEKVFILSESHAEALLFGYFSEILFNAFKYADHDKDEFLTLVFDEKNIDDKMYLICSWQNPVKDKSPSMLGTGKGLDAIQEDLKQLNNVENPEESLLVSQQKNQFQVTLFFKQDILYKEPTSEEDLNLFL